MGVKFKCLGAKCPSSCCGAFTGEHQGIKSVHLRGMSEIPLDNRALLAISRLTAEGVDVPVRMEGRPQANGNMYLVLNHDKSCPLHRDGKCMIYDSRPPVCRAYPFDKSMFCGLCVDDGCVGVKIVAEGKGDDLSEHEEAVDTAYRLQLGRE